MPSVKPNILKIHAGVGIALEKDAYRDRLISSLSNTLSANSLALSEEYLERALAILRLGSAEIPDAMRKLGNELGVDLWERVGSEVVLRQELAYTSGTVGVTNTTSFDFNATDEKALGWLNKDATYWIGGYYGKDLSRNVAQTISAAFLEGLATDDLADLLRAEWGDAFKRSDAYWQGFATNVITRSSNFGITEGFVRAGIETGRIRAIIDDTTSDICRFLDGKIVYTQDMVSHRDKIINLTDPEQIKEAAPWASSVEQVESIEQAVANTGRVPTAYSFPPYHYHCRSTVVAVIE